MSGETAKVENGVFCISAGRQTAEFQMNGLTTEPRTFTICTSNYLDEGCFIDLSMANARLLRDWLNAQDLSG